ncbi:MAG: integrase arm-type DNA-binding domain-containing protein [Vicinamibacterales bacterium]|jgi:integrase|nr:integrase arm-type DNA-binding domain-containing protein [Vicinamibacterales bacterium]
MGGEKHVTRRHPQQALTARAVRAAGATGRTRRLADGGGLYLVVAPSGSKSWVLRTVVKGKRCDIGLGGVALVSLKEAREQALRFRKIARAGGDPFAERRHERRSVPTFEAAATQVHATHASTFRNEKHRKQWLSSLTLMFTAFGAKRVDAITSADILTAITPQWLEHPETSRRVLQRLRVIFEWCKAQGFYAGDNPTQGITRVLPKHRAPRGHHAALPYADVPAFLDELCRANASETVKLAFEFMILCATRTSETLGASWDEIDREAETWTIPGDRMKAGMEHRVPLAPRCVEILERVETDNEGALVFPGRTANRPLSNMAFLMTLRRMHRTDITPHGFRSSFRDWAAEQTNAPRAVCEAALAHTLRDKTEAAYHRTDLFERRRELMESWSAFATTRTAEVVPIRA